MVTLGRGQISFTCQFQRFLYQTLCVLSQIKDRKHIEQNIHSVAKVMPGVGLRESKILAWGLAMAPHRLCALAHNVLITCMHTDLIVIPPPMQGSS